MRVTDTKTPILAAIFAVLVFAAIPQTTQAQNILGGSTTSLGSGIGTPSNCTGLTGVGLCQCNQNNAYSKNAQEKAIAAQRVIQNGPIPSMKLMYCWNQIQAMIQSVGAFTTGTSGGLGTVIWNFIVTTLINAVMNMVCQAAVGLISSLISMAKSWMCLPLPHFSLGLSGGLHFAQGTCNGISLFNLMSGLAGQRPVTPNVWPVWGYTPTGAP